MPDEIEGTVEEFIRALAPEDVEVRDFSKREIDMRLLPWDLEIETVQGPEVFRKGAFADAIPGRVFLFGPNHEARIGLQQDGGATITRVPIGKALSVTEKDDGAHATFKVARTQSGDEALALAADGIVSGVSIEFRQVQGGTDIDYTNGRRTRNHRRVLLTGVTTTQIPAYGPQAAVLAVRSEVEKGEPSVTETEAQPDVIDSAITGQHETAISQLRSMQESSERILDRLDKLETRSRQEIIIPGQPEKPKDSRLRSGEWMKTVLKMMTGERVSDTQLRTLDDLITSDNIGVVPDSTLNELIGIIDPARPFLETTRRLPTPDTGLTLTVPVIVTRPEVGVQVEEKDDIASNTTSITTTGFDAITIAGGGDISLQLLKRSSPSYLSLYLQLLAEAYATDGDALAVAKLLDSGVTPGGGYIDAEDLLIGDAWTNAVSVSRLLRPDRIWMSTRAIQEFIDAKANGTNEPLYSNLAADITVANGARGLISGLTPVYVPGLDGSGCDVLIGPSRGFAWAEDGTFTLQVDVPSKAGRDVAIVGILWFAPLYPSAFTSYRFAS